ncbi:MAG: hypothetical protein PHH11_08750 [Methylomonas sp.]|nr:hypothetical protein [Methylomonas sp.]
MQYPKTLLAAGLLLSVTFNAEAALTPYTSAGESLVYSSVSDITWTGDANLLGTLEAGNPNLVSTIISTIGSISDTPNTYDTPANSGHHTLTTADFGANGLVSWFGAQAFVGYLNTINYGGSHQWALPGAGANPQHGYNQTGGQFGQLFYDELGGTAGNKIPNTANFANEQAFAFYWLGTEASYPPSSPSSAWGFATHVGFQYFGPKYDQVHAWAVSPGLVSAVPVPGAVWLFGTGLVGLLGLKRRGHAG